MAGHISPLPRGRHLSAVLIIVCVVGLAFSPSAEGGHGRPIHVSENPLAVKVMNADVDPAQAGFGDVACNDLVGALVLRHGQVPSPRLTGDFGVAVRLLLLHQQIHLTVCLFYASNSCRGGQC